jgi:hypothetical protein
MCDPPNVPKRVTPADWSEPWQQCRISAPPRMSAHMAGT